MPSLAIIPARSGSKGLVNKNIKLLDGKPLMAYSIEAARESGMFDTIHVSTDSKEYADIAKSYMADVPFLRVEQYATDSSSTWDAVLYVLEEYKKRGKSFDKIAILQPTSPLRTKQHIIDCYHTFIKKEAEAVVSVCEAEHSPLICGQIPPDGSMKGFLDKNIIFSPRQKLPKYYRLNGAIFLLNTNVLYDFESIYDSNIFSYVMDQYASIDIDTEMDFIIAEQIMKEMKKCK